MILTKRLGWQLLNSEEGSAVIEFIVLTIPLFLPFALYLGLINSQTQAAYDAHNLARQISRAFVTSPSEDLTASRVKAVVDVFSREVLSRHGIQRTPEVSISCAQSPCLSPNNTIKVTVALDDDSLKPSGYLRGLSNKSTRVIATNTEIVDPWRSTA